MSIRPKKRDITADAVLLLWAPEEPGEKAQPGIGTNDEVARFVGADSWTVDAMEGVRICRRLLGEM